MNRARGVRVALGLTILLVVGLLFLDQADPWRQREFVDSVQYPMTTDQRAAIRHEIDTLVKAAHADPDFTFNEPRHAGHLGFFVTRAAARGTLKIGSGNALYDPRYNIVLLDEQFISPFVVDVVFGGVSPKESNRQQGFGLSWRRFALLHELGHQQLHRGLSHRLPLGRSNVELEADRFALDAMTRIPDELRHGYSEGTLHIEDSAYAALSATDKNLVRLATAAQETAISLMFASGSHSSFYADPTHATFIERFQLILHDFQTSSDTVLTYRDLALAYLDRLGRTRERVVRELQVTDPITDVDMNNGVLIVKSKESEFRVDSQLAMSRGPPLSLLGVSKMSDGLSRDAKSSPRNAPSQVDGRSGAGWTKSLDLSAIRAALTRDVAAEYGMNPAQCVSHIAPAASSERLYVTLGCQQERDFFALVTSSTAPFLRAERPEAIPTRNVTDFNPPPFQDAVTVEVDGKPTTLLFVDTSEMIHNRSFEARSLGPVSSSASILSSAAGDH